MSRIWKEPYSEAAALAAGIHDFEGAAVVGAPKTRWIFYVRECGFTFSFFSTAMIAEYLEFYSKKVLPTSQYPGVSPFSKGRAASVGDGQSRFERLPGKLRSEAKRPKIVKALEKALARFRKEEEPNQAPGSVTDRAGARSAPAPGVAHL